MLRPVCACAAIVICLSCSKSPQPDMPAPAVAAADVAADHSTSAHGNHDARHGGTVYMKGELHFEVVLSGSGTHRIYFSDAARAELPAATASEVTVSLSNGEASTETLRAEVDDSGESWIAKGPPLKGHAATVRVSFVVENEPYWIDVPYIDAGDGDAARQSR